MFTAINRSIARAGTGGRARSRDRATGRGPCDGSVASCSFGGSSNAESFVSPARPQARTPTDATVPVRRRRNRSDGRPEPEEVVA
jgi:hypothetical protein